MNTSPSFSPLHFYLATLAAVGFASTSVFALQESRSPFDAATVQFSDDTSVVRLADIDGDGLKDAVGIYWKDSFKSSVTLTVNRSLGDGSYQWLWKKSFPSKDLDTWGVEAGNFDGDPKSDLATAFRDSSTSTSTVRIFETSSGGILTETVQWNANMLVRSLVVADFDEDGLDDIALAGNGVKLYRNTGSGFQLTSSLPAGTQIKSGSFDTAPGPDLLVLDGNKVQLVSCAGAVLAAQASYTIGLTPVQMRNPVAGDIDGDGDDDIVIFSDSGLCAILRQTGAGSFQSEPIFAGGPATDLADIDGDGDLDGVCCGGSSGPYPLRNMMKADFRISLNDGSGAFAKANEMIGFGAFRLAGADDIDGDGDLDLVAGRTVIFNRGTGFTPTPQPFSAITNGLLWANDIDTDGDLDLRFANKMFGSSFSQENDGTGNFQSKISLFPNPAGSLITGPTSEGDFDGDGDVDLILYRWATPQVFQDMRLYLNTSGGDYVDAGAATIGGVPFQSTTYFGGAAQNTVADLDGDGDLDIYAAGGRVWLNDGTGYFTGGQASWFLTIASDVVDLDGDGILDLVGQGFVAYGLGAGTFTAPISVFGYTDSSEDRLAILDLDGDGDLDVASWPRTGSSTILSVQIQTAPRVFQESPLTIDYPFGLSSVDDRRVIGGDFDADGDGDLLLTPIGTDSRRGRIFWNDGSGAFPETTDQMVGVPNLFVDIDDDGDLDLVGKRLVRGTLTDATTAGLRRQYGDAVAGLGRMEPTLGATGPSLAGGALEIMISGAAGGSRALLAVGLAEDYAVGAPFIGTTALTTAPIFIVSIALSGLPGEAGTGRATVQMALPRATSGSTFYGQAFVIDAAAASGILSQTNGLEITIP